MGNDRTPTVIAGRTAKTVRPACDAEFVIVVFNAELWAWDARRADSWTFVSLPADASEEIRDLTGGSRRGFGSLRVRVTLGGTTWTTSIFPGSGSSNYVLPINPSSTVGRQMLGMVWALSWADAGGDRLGVVPTWCGAGSRVVL
jgi:hypothetical protein